MANWKEYKLGEIAELRREGFIPGTQNIMPYIGLEHIEAAGLRLNGIGKSSEITSQKARFYSGDILYGKLRPYFKKVYNPKFEGVCSTDIYVIKPKDGIDSTFLFYLIATDEFTSIANAGSTGTRMPRADWKHLSDTNWNVPDLPTQTAIAEILSSLDDKIELNNKINQELEALAQALFEHWFVDFEFPNEKGKPYKSSGGEMIESEIGEIPKGWSNKCLYEFANYINGAAYKDMYFTDEPDALPVIKIVELKNGISPQTKFTNTNLGDKYRIETGDILFSWSGSPETSIDTFLWAYGDAWLNQHIFKVICESPEERAFVYSMLKYWKPKFISIAKDKQTTGLGHVTIKDLKEQLQPNPSVKILKSFAVTALPIIDCILNNLVEIKSLSELRDTLLPKLISGELEVTRQKLKK